MYTYNVTEEKKIPSKIEFEIEVCGSHYNYVRELVKKICEDHEGKRDLHIKITSDGAMGIDYSNLEASSDH